MPENRVIVPGPSYEQKGQVLSVDPSPLPLPQPLRPHPRHRPSHPPRIRRSESLARAANCSPYTVSSAFAEASESRRRSSVCARTAPGTFSTSARVIAVHPPSRRKLTTAWALTLATILCPGAPAAQAGEVWREANYRDAQCAGMWMEVVL